VREIRTIAVVGAGALGRKIAHAAALAGYRTILEDILPASLRRAETAIRDSLEQAVEQGTVQPAEAESAIARLEFATSLEDAARAAEIVIEAVPDEFDSKEEIFRLLDRICRPETLLVASSHSLRVSDVAAITERPGDIVGMRFRHSDCVGGSIEVISGSSTSVETLQAALMAARRMRLDVVQLSED
jgi:3-hydroxybutyryl-CoA dehydrogenase